jgi:hypothetical protein
MRWTGCRDHRTQPSVNGKALEQTSFVLGLRSETLFQGNIFASPACYPNCSSGRRTTGRPTQNQPALCRTEVPTVTQRAGDTATTRFRDVVARIRATAGLRGHSNPAFHLFVVRIACRRHSPQRKDEIWQRERTRDRPRLVQRTASAATRKIKEVFTWDRRNAYRRKF